MKHILVELMTNLTVLSEEEAEAIQTSFPVKTFEKGSYLLKEGQMANNAYFVVKGCIREYELLDGEEQTTGFYLEHQSAINFDSLTNSKPSKKHFVCMEKTTVAILNKEKEKSLYRKFPRFEAYCREGVEQMMGAQQTQLSKFMVMNPKERYLSLLADNPDLINRVPQYHIASYLGVKPETLSRIRKRIASKR